MDQVIKENLMLLIAAEMKRQFDAGTMSWMFTSSDPYITSDPNITVSGYLDINLLSDKIMVFFNEG